MRSTDRGNADIASTTGAAWFADLATAFTFVSAPFVPNKSTLTRIDLIKF